MCRYPSRVLPGAMGLLGLIVGLAFFVSYQSYEAGEGGDDLPYEWGLVTAKDDTGMVTIATDMGRQYVLPTYTLKVGDEVKCITEDGHTTCHVDLDQSVEPETTEAPPR